MPVARYKILIERPNVKKDKEGNLFMKDLQTFAPTLPGANRRAIELLEREPEGTTCKIFEITETLVRTEIKEKGEVTKNG